MLTSDANSLPLGPTSRRLVNMYSDKGDGGGHEAGNMGYGQDYGDSLSV